MRPLRVPRVLATLAVGASLLASCVSEGGGVAPTGSSSTMATGCGVAGDVQLPDHAATPIANMRGHPLDLALAGLVVAPSDPRAGFIHPLVPTQPPAGLSLQEALLTPWGPDGVTSGTALLLIYAPSSVVGLSSGDILAGGGWIVSESAASGQDALAVQAALDSIGKADHYVHVQVGPHDGLLVHQDARDLGPHPAYALFWSDGARDMVVQADVDTAPVINFARSLYCGS